MDYAGLKTAIGSYSKRTSQAAAQADDCIDFTEALLNFGTADIAPLRVREMVDVEDLTPSSGICTLPTDYLQYRRVVEKVSPRRELQYITLDAAEVLYPSRAGGPGSKFTIVGSSLYTFPLVSNTVELTYFQKIPALSDSVTTNWLIEKSPEIYLRGCLMQLALFVRDDEEAAKQGGLFRGLVDGLNRQDMIGNYARAPLTMRGYTP